MPGFPESTEGPKKVWTTDPIFKGARETIEEAWQGIQDFNEILWAVHGVYDPLFGQFARREFFGRLAANYGDNLTPFFIAQTQLYFQTTKAALSDLFFTSLGDDPEFGDLNRTWFRAWTGKWLQKTAEALHDFLGIYAKVDKSRASAIRPRSRPPSPASSTTGLRITPIKSTSRSTPTS